MLDIFSTPDELKRAIIALLVKVSASDGENHLNEVAYTMKVAHMLGLSSDDVRDIASDPHKFKLEPPSDEQSRMTILYYLLFLMEADGIVSPEEEQVVKDFGFKLGFRTELTHDLILLIKKYTDTNLPPKEMLGKIKAYLN